MATIADMTVEQLKAFVEQMIDERLTQMLGTFEIPDELDESNSLTWDELRALVERHRWTPPEGAVPSSELLREDRDG